MAHGALRPPYTVSIMLNDGEVIGRDNLNSCLAKKNEANRY